MKRRGRATRVLGPAIAAVGVAAILLAVAARTRRPRLPEEGRDDRTEAGDFRFDTRTWAFPLDRYDVGIEDVGMTSALDAVLARTGAELAVNGGFFDTKDKALGLAVTHGKELAPFAKSLSGGVVTIDGARARLHATESFAPPEGGPSFAVQCRPRLVVGGIPNIKSDDGKRSERTALCLRDGGRTVEVVVVRGRAGEPGGPSLFHFARWLVAHGCEDALNLDGGPSTGAAWRERERDDAGARVETSPPRGPLRHAITFTPRGSGATHAARLDGRDFPDKVLALTWDDGPDAGTLELARMLRDRKIAATFFVVGEWVPKVSSDPGEGKGVFETGHVKMPVLRELVALGHRLGNHTMHHVLLGEADGPTVVRELVTNQRALDPFVGDGLRLFRAPGGSWSDAAARALDGEPELRPVIGPFHWDIDRKDWEGSLDCKEGDAEADCEAAAPGGKRRVRPAVVARRYLATIESAGHGIVLLHDRVGHVGSRYALDVARELVPALVAKGYVFAPPLLRFGPLELRTSARFGPDLAIQDVDGDGRGDLCDADGCALATTTPAGSPPRVAFGPKQPHARARDARPQHAADLNGDGRPDTCTASGDALACALAPAGPSTWLAGGLGTTWTLGDLDGNGRADLCTSAPEGVRCALSP